jgi:predicted DNA-binding ribbon-helix-helix protein
MTNGVIKRSVAIAGHRTSVSLEEPFWETLREIAERRGISVQALIGQIDSTRGGQNLSSAIRVFVLHAVRGDSILPAAPGSAAQA